MTHECFDVWQSYVAASFAPNGTLSDPFASRGYTTSFHHGTITTSLEGYFGNFGDVNNFFGIVKGSVTVNPTPVLPRPRPRPIRPPGRRPPGGRRGPLETLGVCISLRHGRASHRFGSRRAAGKAWT
jgi:hypothetical protein